MSGGRIRSWARLLRLPLAPTAAWDVVACLGFALAAGGLPLDVVRLPDWLLLAVTSLLLYGTGMALNDLADRGRDRSLAPDRPLPSGEISAWAAGAAVVVLALAAFALGGGQAGNRWVVGVALLCIVLYDLFAKRQATAGAATMGLVRFSNASIGVVPLVAHGYAPAWVLLGPLALGLYSAAVTILSTTEEEERASLGPTLAMRILASLACALVAVLPWIAVGHPTLGVLVGGGLFTSVAFARRPKKGPVKRQVLEMLLGLYFVSMCLATAGDGGSLLANGAALAVAFALIWLSQILIRALR